MRTTISFLALLTFAACSSSGPSTSGVAGASGATEDSVPTLRALIDSEIGSSAEAASFASALTSFEADAATAGLAVRNNTDFEFIPPSGQADFVGFVQVNAGPTANLAAELEITADFGPLGRVTGDITSPFFAAGENGLEEYNDDVNIVFGATRARGVANNIRLDISGTIDNGVGDAAATNTVVVDAIIDGKFIGSPIIGAAGQVSTGDTVAGNAANRGPAISTLTLNGTAVESGSAGFLVLAE